MDHHSSQRYPIEKKTWILSYTSLKRCFQKFLRDSVGIAQVVVTKLSIPLLQNFFFETLLQCLILGVSSVNQLQPAFTQKIFLSLSCNVVTLINGFLDLSFILRSYSEFILWNPNFGDCNKKLIEVFLLTLFLTKRGEWIKKFLFRSIFKLWKVKWKS